MEKIFNMDSFKFDEIENPLYIAYKYFINKDYEKNKNNSLFYHNTYNKEYLLNFLVHELANNMSNGTLSNTALFNNVSFCYTYNSDINSVIKLCSKNHSAESIARNKDFIKPSVLKTLEIIKKEDSYFKETKITSFLESNTTQLFCGGDNFPALFKSRLQQKFDDDSFYFTLSDLYNPTNNEKYDIPRGTLNYVCARPSAGKTTALLSITLDALEQNEKLEQEGKEKRKISFITTEESPDALYIKLIKAYFYKHYYNDDSLNDSLFKVVGHNSQRFFENQLYKYYSGELQITNNENVKDLEKIQKELIESEKAVSQYFYNGELTFSNTDDYSSFNDLLDTIKSVGENGIVILDYIQHLPQLPTDKDNLILSSRLDQLREASRQILGVCRTNNLICIAGAQMKRESKTEKTTYLSMENIRECSDFEQDAHLIIGLGKEKRNFFYATMKYRDIEWDNSIVGKLSGNPGYSFIKSNISTVKGETTVMLYDNGATDEESGEEKFRDPNQHYTADELNSLYRGKKLSQNIIDEVKVYPYEEKLQLLNDSLNSNIWKKIR